MGTISTPNQQSASNVESKLKNNGGAIAGIPILSSSSDLYYGDTLYTVPPPIPNNNNNTQSGNNDNDDRGGPNVPLIVGLSVGLGGAALLALLATIVYLCYRKRKQR